MAWHPSVRLRAEEPRVRFRHRAYLIVLLSPGRAIEVVRYWLRDRWPPAELLAYVHSGYAARWGEEAVSNGQHSKIWSLTLGRVRAWSGRRRRVADQA
jgi:hypothetical protein